MVLNMGWLFGAGFEYFLEDSVTIKAGHDCQEGSRVLHLLPVRRRLCRHAATTVQAPSIRDAVVMMLKARIGKESGGAGAVVDGGGTNADNVGWTTPCGLVHAMLATLM